MEDVKIYKPSYTNLNIANMTFAEYLEFAKEVGILKDEREKLEDWQIKVARKRFKNNPVLKEVQRLIYRENRNAIIFVQGKPGTGKSYVSLKLAEMFDPTFKKNIWNRVIYDKNTFFFRLLDPTIPLKKGHALIMEELGTQMDSRTWYDFAQRVFNYIIQTFRYRNLLLIFNAPRIREIDPRILGYINILINTQPVDRTNSYWINKNRWKAYLVEENQVASVLRGQPIYYLKKFRDEDGIEVEDFITNSPSSEVVEYYEKISRKWKLELNYTLAKEVAERYMFEDNKGKLDSIIVEIKNNLGQYTKMRGDKLVLLDEVVRHKFNLNVNEIKYIKQMFELEMQQQKNIKAIQEMRDVIDNTVDDEVSDILESILKR